MKLELKHLAGYLPYELNTKYQLSKVEVLITEQIDEVRDKKLTLDNCDFVLKFCKPILRPLSDLTKEIEVNEEKFIPKDWIGYNYIGENLGTNMATWSHRTVQKLLEWHFDIYGLIEKCLAIDINTLNK